jgi:hypothetical protein
VVWATVGLNSAVAQPDTTNLRDRWLDAQHALLLSQAAVETSGQENRVIGEVLKERAPASGPGEEDRDSPPGWRKFQQLLIGGEHFTKLREGLRTSLKDLKKRLEKEGEDAEAQWRVRLARLFDVRRREGIAAARSDAVIARQLGLAGLAAGVVGVGLAFSTAARRRRPRWERLSVGKRLVRGLGVLAVLAVVVVLGWSLVRGLQRSGLPLSPAFRPADVFDEPVGFQTAMANEIASCEEQSRALNLEIHALSEKSGRGLKEIAARWQKELGFDGPQEVWALQGEALAPLHDVLVQARLNRKLADQVEEGNAELARAEQRQANARGPLLTGGIRIALAVLVLLLALLPSLVVSWAMARRRAAERRICPRCLDGGAIRNVALGRLGPRDPVPGFLACSRCEYRFPRIYKNLSRVCFPTVGVVSAGKTHWLAEIYHQIAHGTLPEGVPLTRIPAQPDNTFEALIEEIWKRHRGTGPTTYQEGHVPYPLLFEFRERSPRAEGAMINLFDFGGEMTGARLDVSALRRRALGMDGFLWFLDPTRPGDAGQQKALLDFCNELRQARDLGRGTVLNVPVAVCLTKLDLLPTRSIMAHQALDWLERLRGLPRDARKRDVIRARSELVREALVTLFQGWDVLQTLHGQFGDNCLFFPLTPVGIDEDDDVLCRLPTGPDSDTLRDRNFQPFGILEPLLWLLDMHGYDILV